MFRHDKPASIQTRLLGLCMSMLLLASCGGSGSSQGSNAAATTTVTISLGQSVAAALGTPGAVPANVQSMSVDVFDAGGAPIAGPVFANAPNFTVTLTLPNGSGIQFVVKAFSAANGTGTLLYQGSATADLTGTPVTLPVIMQIVLNGIAAAGLPVGNANAIFTGANGQTVTAVTNAVDGSYSLVVPQGLSFPVLIKVVRPPVTVAGVTTTPPPLYSMATDAGIAHANTLTTLAVAQALAAANATQVEAKFAAAPPALAAAKTSLSTAIGGIMTQLGLTQFTRLGQKDPLSDPTFVADGTGLDAVMDALALKERDEDGDGTPDLALTTRTAAATAVLKIVSGAATKAIGAGTARFSIPGAAVAGDDIGGTPVNADDIILLGQPTPGRLTLPNAPVTGGGFTAQQLSKIIPIVVSSFEEAGVDVTLAANQTLIQQFLDRYLANLSPASHPGLSFDDAFESDQEDRIKVLLTGKVANGSLTANFDPVAAANSIAGILLDTTPPVVTAPQPLTVAAVNANGTPKTDTAIANWLNSATATDNVDGALSVSNDAPATFPIGTTTVTFTATDAAGNTGTATSTVTVTQAAGQIQGTVKDASGNALSGVGISIADSSTNVVVATATTDTSGVYTVSSIPIGTYVITATLSGYNSATANVTISQSGTTTAPPISLTPVAAATGDVTGRVVSAIDASGISGATVELRLGVNAPATDPVVATATTGAGGAYSITGLAAGTYTATASAAGFAASSVTVTVIGGTTTAAPDISLSPTLSAGEMRIVLSWGAAPDDLDAHLVGPISATTTGSQQFHVYFANRTYPSTNPVVVLDRDDTSAFGPETITISQLSAGTYRYFIYDYSDGSCSTCTALTGTSNAVVKVYQGASTTPAYTFNVPATGAGDTWEVFELDGATGAITPVNRISYSANVPVGVTISPAAASIQPGGTQQFTATLDNYRGTDPDITSSATWTSSDTNVATVDTAGLVTGVGAGSATITATDATSGYSATATVTVDQTPPTVTAPQSITVKPTTAAGTPKTDSQFAAWFTSATATDNVDGALSVSNDAPATFPIGTTTVTFSATDAAGNTGTATSTVTVEPLAGTSWTQQQAPVTMNWLYDVTWSGTGFVAVGDMGTILTSPDGITWTAQASGTTNLLESVTWSGTKYVAVGGQGTILTSPDGITWTAQASGRTNPLIDVTWSGTKYVAVGGQGTILTSPDGITWTSQTSGTPSQLNGVTWSGSQFVAVGLWGGSGTILTSPDGVTWTQQASGTTSYLWGVTWSGTKYVAVGSSGTILTSPDGITWTAQASGTTNPLNGVTWSGSQFVAVGGVGTILTSPDGVTWTQQASGTTNDLYGVTWSGTQFAAVGDVGTILLSNSEVDSDADGLSDAMENAIGTNPNLADSDGDGLNDGIEHFNTRTNPLNADTDGDGFSDGAEVSAGTDPNNSSSFPTATLGWSTLKASGDTTTAATQFGSALAADATDIEAVIGYCTTQAADLMSNAAFKSLLGNFTTDAGATLPTAAGLAMNIANGSKTTVNWVQKFTQLAINGSQVQADGFANVMPVLGGCITRLETALSAGFSNQLISNPAGFVNNGVSANVDSDDVNLLLGILYGIRSEIYWLDAYNWDTDVDADGVKDATLKSELIGGTTYQYRTISIDPKAVLSDPTFFTLRTSGTILSTGVADLAQALADAQASVARTRTALTDFNNNNGRATNNAHLFYYANTATVAADISRNLTDITNVQSALSGAGYTNPAMRQPDGTTAAGTIYADRAYTGTSPWDRSVMPFGSIVYDVTPDVVASKKNNEPTYFYDAATGNVVFSTPYYTTYPDVTMGGVLAGAAALDKQDRFLRPAGTIVLNKNGTPIVPYRTYSDATGSHSVFWPGNILTDGTNMYALEVDQNSTIGTFAYTFYDVNTTTGALTAATGTVTTGSLAGGVSGSGMVLGGNVFVPGGSGGTFGYWNLGAGSVVPSTPPAGVGASLNIIRASGTATGIVHWSHGNGSTSQFAASTSLTSNGNQTLREQYNFGLGINTSPVGTDSTLGWLVFDPDNNRLMRVVTGATPAAAKIYYAPLLTRGTTTAGPYRLAAGKFVDSTNAPKLHFYALPALADFPTATTTDVSP